MPYSGMTRSATRKRRQDVKDALSILYKRICTCQCIYGAVGNILNWETALLTFDMLSLLARRGVSLMVDSSRRARKFKTSSRDVVMSSFN